MIEAVIFDYDGVIVHTEDLWDESDRKYLASHGVLGIDPRVYKEKIVGKSLAEGARLLGELFGITGDYEKLGQERFDFAKFILSQKVEFIPGFLEFKNSLGDIKSGVGTASHPALFKVVDERLGISKLFNNHIYYISDVGNVGKPAPDIFLHVAKKIQVKPENCVVIEDSPNGLVAARLAGMKGIGITTTFDRSKLSDATIVVDTYDQIDLKKM